MSDVIFRLQQLITDVVLPNLKGVQANQVEQHLETDRLYQSIDEFRAEMHQGLAEIRAEIAVCRAELHELMRQVDAASARGNAPGVETLIH